MGRRKIHEEVFELRMVMPEGNLAITMPNGFQLIQQGGQTHLSPPMSARSLQQLVGQLTRMEKLELMQTILNSEDEARRIR